MRITVMRKNPWRYTCSVYLVRGDWNRLEDVNTLVDAGTDGFVIEELDTMATGVGKRKVDVVVATHAHFDHVGGLAAIHQRYHCEALAFSPFSPLVEPLHDGQQLMLGDAWFEVIHTPGHSTDSICLYGRSEGVLFSGDTPLNIRTPGGSYSPEFVASLERLATLRVKTIFPGHDDPITTDAEAMIRHSLDNVRRSQIVDWGHQRIV